MHDSHPPRARRSDGPDGRVVFVACFVLISAACSKPRNLPDSAPVFRGEVDDVLLARCGECHGESEPEGGWNATSFLGVIGCVSDGTVPATTPADDTAPILVAIGDETHAEIGLSDAERRLIRDWILAGAPDRSGRAHPQGFIDPRSTEFHGSVLRSEHWLRMLDGSVEGACGGCHEGAPARPSGVTVAADRVPACTTCHNQPNGVLACSTCHGNGTRAAPPRDACFFPGAEEKRGAHDAHITDGAWMSALSCTTCHPVDEVGALFESGLHGNGTVNVAHDPAVAGGDAIYDPDTKQCTNRCHLAEGTRDFVWTDTTPVVCGDCHPVPPVNHYSERCELCHEQIDRSGGAPRLIDLSKHMNGTVDAPDIRCGTCHGDGADDSWPTTGRHPAHRNTRLTTPIACTTCHIVPSEVREETHLDLSERPEVTFDLGSRAAKRGANPTFADGACSSIACHGVGLSGVSTDALRWDDDSGTWGECGACHGVPPDIEPHAFNWFSPRGCVEYSCHTTSSGFESVDVEKHLNGCVELLLDPDKCE